MHIKNISGVVTYLLPFKNRLNLPFNANNLNFPIKNHFKTAGSIYRVDVTHLNNGVISERTITYTKEHPCGKCNLQKFILPNGDVFLRSSDGTIEKKYSDGLIYHNIPSYGKYYQTPQFKENKPLAI